MRFKSVYVLFLVAYFLNPERLIASDILQFASLLWNTKAEFSQIPGASDNYFEVSKQVFDVLKNKPSHRAKTKTPGLVQKLFTGYFAVESHEDGSATIFRKVPVISKKIQAEIVVAGVYCYQYRDTIKKAAGYLSYACCYLKDCVFNPTPKEKFFTDEDIQAASEFVAEILSYDRVLAKIYLDKYSKEGFCCAFNYWYQPYSAYKAVDSKVCSAIKGLPDLESLFREFLSGEADKSELIKELGLKNHDAVINVANIFWDDFGNIARDFGLLPYSNDEKQLIRETKKAILESFQKISRLKQ